MGDCIGDIRTHDIGIVTDIKGDGGGFLLIEEALYCLNIEAYGNFDSLKD